MPEINFYSANERYLENLDAAIVDTGLSESSRLLESPVQEYSFRLCVTVASANVAALFMSISPIIGFAYLMKSKSGLAIEIKSGQVFRVRSPQDLDAALAAAKSLGSAPVPRTKASQLPKRTSKSSR